MTTLYRIEHHGQAGGDGPVHPQPKLHPITRRLPNGILRYEPRPGEGVEYEKGDISLSVKPDGSWQVLGCDNRYTIANANDVADCLRAAAEEAQR